jgi:hypothetical protein
VDFYEGHWDHAADTLRAHPELCSGSMRIYGWHDKCPFHFAILMNAPLSFLALILDLAPGELDTRCAFPGGGQSITFSYVAFDAVDTMRFLLVRGADPNQPLNINHVDSFPFDTTIYAYGSISRLPHVRLLIQYGAHYNRKSWFPHSAIREDVRRMACLIAICSTKGRLGGKSLLRLLPVEIFRLLSVALGGSPPQIQEGANAGTSGGLY